jgi:hypothetical protein
MKVIYNKMIPFRGFSAINLFGVVFARKECEPLNAFTVHHEQIHTEQMRELGYIPFYLWYVLEWLVKLCFYGKQAYYHISFEQEAYIYMDCPGYVLVRDHYSFLKYIKR